MFRRIRRIRKGISNVLSTPWSLYFLLAEMYYNYAMNHFPQLQRDKCLARHGFKVYSQNDEDGIIEHIFREVGVKSRHFVEIGVGNGLTNNTLYLLLKGWTGK